MSSEFAFESKIYREVGLANAKIEAIKKEDILEDLSDIEYLRKLEVKIEKIIETLSIKKLIPKKPTEFLDTDFKQLQKVLMLFSSNDWKILNKKLKETEESLSSSSKPVSKSDLQNFLIITSDFKDLLETKCKKFINLNNEDFWANTDSIDPVLLEYSLIKLAKPLSNQDLDDQVRKILRGVDQFKVNWLTRINDINQAIESTVEQWGSFKTKENELVTLFKKGNLSEVRRILDDTKKFSDIHQDLRKQYQIYSKINAIGEDLYEVCQKFLKNSTSSKEWASINKNLVKKYPSRLKTISDLLKQLHKQNIDSLRVNSKFKEYKDLTKNVQDEIIKSQKFVDRKERSKKVKKILLSLAVMATAGYSPFYFSEWKKEQLQVKIREKVELMRVNRVLALEEGIKDFSEWLNSKENIELLELTKSFNEKINQLEEEKASLHKSLQEGHRISIMQLEEEAMSLVNNYITEQGLSIPKWTKSEGILEISSVQAFYGVTKDQIPSSKEFETFDVVIKPSEDLEYFSGTFYSLSGLSWWPDSRKQNSPLNPIKHKFVALAKERRQLVVEHDTLQGSFDARIKSTHAAYREALITWQEKFNLKYEGHRKQINKTRKDLEQFKEELLSLNQNGPLTEKLMENFRNEASKELKQ